MITGRQRRIRFRSLQNKYAPSAQLGGNMRITWYGTAAILLETEDERLLFDPFVQLKGGENPNTLDDFLQEENICITHGHLDHLFFVPQILEEGDATVHCTAAAAASIASFTDLTGNVVLIRPGDSWNQGGFQITVLPGRHAKAGVKQMLRRALDLPRLFGHMRNAAFLAWANLKFPEHGETVVYRIEAEGKTILLLGSMGLDRDYAYPKDADLLILPFQGPEDVTAQAIGMVERLHPHKILLDHFDDAFPPVSASVDTRRFKKVMEEKFPAVQVVKPKAGKTIKI